MKIVLIAGALLFATALSNPSSAQISLSVNIGAQPSWGPTGYDHAEYYYLPDIQCYYYVPGHQFIYQNHGHWAFTYDLPPRYRGYDLFHSYKVVINEPQPYLHFEEHRAKYDHFRGGPNEQVFIRDSREDRYRDHWHDQHEADEEWRHHGDGDRHRDGDHRDGDHHD